MEMTKFQKRLSKFVGQNENYNFVKFDGKTAVATDSFRLVEITNKQGKKIPLAKKANKSFPEYEPIFDGLGDCIEINMNADLLTSVLQAIGDLKNTPARGSSRTFQVLLRVPKEKDRPIEIRSEGQDHTARALVMPITV